MKNIIVKITIGILILISFLLGLDVFTVKKGSKEICNSIGLGDTKIYISSNYDLYKDDSTGEYYMYSPCGEDGAYLYYIKFERNIILDRVQEIIISYDPTSSIDFINEKLKQYGFNKQIQTKDSSIELKNKEGNMIFNLGTFDSKNNYLPIYFTIIK